MVPMPLQFKWKIEVCVLYHKTQSSEAQSPAHSAKAGDAWDKGAASPASFQAKVKMN